MASRGSFPKAYVNDVPNEGADPTMVYVPFDRMDIGSRKSGLPETVSSGPRSLEHVGRNATKKGG